MLQYNSSANLDRGKTRKICRETNLIQHIPKLLQVQFAQFLNNLLEYSNELTYFAINAFQTSSLRRVQMHTLQRFNDCCIPHSCVYYYNLDSEFDGFVQKIRLLLTMARRTFSDMRIARIHFPHGTMMSIPLIHRSIDVFKLNISRLHDLRQIHQDIGHDLLLPDDQLYLALDLLVTDFELLNCELECQIKFTDAMVLQSITKDIFLQNRIALTWIYPAVKFAAYRPSDLNAQHEIKPCEGSLIVDDGSNLSGEEKKPLKQFIAADRSYLTKKTMLPTPNMNQNFAIDSTSDCSIENQKKRRKHSKQVNSTTRITTIVDDFNRYINERKSHHAGRTNLKEDKLNQVVYKTIAYNQIIRNMRKCMDENVHKYLK